MKTRSIPVKLAARVLKKDPCWVRAGIISGWLPIGVATRNDEVVTSVQEINGQKGRINYYISPKKFEEYCGYKEEE